jgi:phosphatidylserine decarboxylase
MEGAIGLTHQYIERNTGRILGERLSGDRFIRVLYSCLRENAGFMFRALTSKTMNDLIAWSQYDSPISRNRNHIAKIIMDLGIPKDEILEFEKIRSVRDLFERKITYWNTRPMPEGRERVVSPCDARMIPGSLDKKTRFYVKDKFFDLDELIGQDKGEWLGAFKGGHYAVFRLTPDKYHYNHSPVTGRVADFYEIDGRYHSCNPGAVIEVVTPHSKNRRVVTIIDSDIQGGTGAGLVAMIEIVALMIGGIEQAVSDCAYEEPRGTRIGDIILKGRPKSLFRPGSSTVILLFQKGRFAFSQDLLENVERTDVASRFSRGFGRSLVETDLDVRSEIGKALVRNHI